MAKVIVLDSGPFSDACRKRVHPDVERLTWWWIQAQANGPIVAIPEIADRRSAETNLPEKPAFSA